MKISVRPQFQPAIELEGSATLRLVIPTGAKRSGGTCFSLHRQPIQSKAPPPDLSSRPERSEVEGSAVFSTLLRLLDSDFRQSERPFCGFLPGRTTPPDLYQATVIAALLFPFISIVVTHCLLLRERAGSGRSRHKIGGQSYRIAARWLCAPEHGRPKADRHRRRDRSQPVSSSVARTAYKPSHYGHSNAHSLPGGGYLRDEYELSQPGCCLCFPAVA